MVGSVSLRQIELTFTDQFCGRLYYGVSACADLAQTASKVAFAVFATLTAAIFLGRSKFLNGWVEFAWEDALLSGEMLQQSLRGIKDPVSAYQEKAKLHRESGWESLFDLKKTKDLGKWECAAAFALYASKGLSEISNVSMATVRVISAFALYAVSLGSAKSLPFLEPVFRYKSFGFVY